MKRVLIIFHSDTGNTRKMADLVRTGCHRVKDVVVDIEPAISVDVTRASGYDAYALGSPDYFSYVAGELKMFFDKVAYDDRFDGKPFVAFGSHGGGGKVVEVIERLGKACKFDPAAPGVLCKGAPESDEDQQALLALGESLANKVLEA